MKDNRESAKKRTAAEAGKNPAEPSEGIYSRNNYEYAKEKIRPEFLKYDQEAMIRRLGLAHDENWLYLDFAGGRYRVCRSSGEVERQGACSEAGSESGPRQGTGEAGKVRKADYLETLSIYDFLCFSDQKVRLEGRWCLVNSLPGVGQNNGLGDSMFRKDAEYFDADPQGLEKACRELGGRKTGSGDVGYELPVFPGFWVRLRFYRSDEEFPPSLSVLFDAAALKYLHYETTYYVVSCLIRELKRRMEE